MAYNLSSIAELRCCKLLIKKSKCNRIHFFGLFVRPPGGFGVGALLFVEFALVCRFLV